MNSVASANCLPGQIRFPYPNPDTNIGSLSKFPSGLRNRSGLNTSGSGYMTGSCKIALERAEAASKAWNTQLTMNSGSLSRLVNRTSVNVFAMTRQKRMQTLGYQETIVNVV